MYTKNHSPTAAQVSEPVTWVSCLTVVALLFITDIEVIESISLFSKKQNYA